MRSSRIYHTIQDMPSPPFFLLASSSSSSLLPSLFLRSSLSRLITTTTPWKSHACHSLHISNRIELQPVHYSSHLPSYNICH